MSARPLLLTPSSQCPTYEALAPQRRRFVDFYLLTYRAATAARRAGYSERTAAQIGHKLLHTPEVADAIRERMAAVRASADDVLHVLSRQMWASLEDVTSLDASGKPVFDGRKAEERGAWPMIRKYKRTTRRIDGDAETDDVLEDRVEVELYSARDAAELLARHHQILDRREGMDVGHMSVTVINVMNAAREDPGQLASFLQWAAQAAMDGHGPLPAPRREE